MIHFHLMAAINLRSRSRKIDVKAKNLGQNVTNCITFLACNPGQGGPQHFNINLYMCPK